MELGRGLHSLGTVSQGTKKIQKDDVGIAKLGRTKAQYPDRIRRDLMPTSYTKK